MPEKWNWIKDVSVWWKSIFIARVLMQHLATVYCREQSWIHTLQNTSTYCSAALSDAFWGEFEVIPAGFMFAGKLFFPTQEVQRCTRLGLNIENPNWLFRYWTTVFSQPWLSVLIRSLSDINYLSRPKVCPFASGRDAQGFNGCAS